jgi:hypothetical protein
MSNLPINIAKAKAYAIMVKNMIGEEPQIIIDQNTGQVKVNHTAEQREKMIAWLDRQIFRSIDTGANEQDLQIGFGQVLFPWAMRYVIPTAAAIFVAGYVTQGFKKLGGAR